MKQLLLALLLLSATFSSALADSPDAILKDYRKGASQAVERLNQSLEKATTQLITKLVSSGDTAGAEELTGQLKSKVAGESVPKPQASAVSLFSMYDEARAKALEPVQKSSVARIDSLLKTAGGAKLETVTELGKVREEVESGKAVDGSAIPVEWTYHSSPTGPVLAKVFFEPDGTAKSESNIGTWRMIRKGVMEAKFPKFTWKVTFKKDYAEIESPPTGIRYLVPVKE